MKNAILFVSGAVALAVGVAFAAEESAGNREPRTPLVAVRHTTRSTKAFVEGDLFDRLCDIHRRHPGSCDEVWLCWSERGDGEWIVRVPTIGPWEIVTVFSETSRR